MATMEIRVESGAIWVLVGLVAFGALYNALVSWLGRRGYTEGYLSLIVALGCAGTLLGAALVDTGASLLVLLAFAASGFPMIAGSVARHMRARARSQDAIRREVLGR